jgi:hypothetical protein
LLHLNNVHPNSWQRAALGEGAIAVGGILVLADLASLWVLPALPLTVALAVKGNDLLAGLLVPVEHPVEHGAEEVASVAVANGWVVAEADGLDVAPMPEADVLSAQPTVDQVDGREAVTNVVADEPSVRVIAASPRRAAARPGAAAARAQVAASRPRRKADG